MRQSERIAVDAPARLHPNGWSSLEVRLLDCSERGFRASCEARVQVGDIVTLEIAGAAPARAYVSWQRGGEIGARFLEPFPLASVPLPQAGAETQLARLLVSRAAAHRANLRDCEQALRERIRNTLPIRRA